MLGLGANPPGDKGVSEPRISEEDRQGIIQHALRSEGVIAQRQP
jgi:hypothetical protein